MKIKIRKSRIADAPRLAKRLRSQDLQELDACGVEPRQALVSSVRLSTHCWTCVVDGNIACMWGCGPKNFVFSQGTVWLLGGPEVEQHALRFLKESKKWVKEMLRFYDTLENSIDARNSVALRWVQWLGAELQPAILKGPKQLPFVPFVMR